MDDQENAEMQARIEELEKSLEEQKSVAAERLEQVMYLQADFDNYRKNMEKHQEFQCVSGRLMRERHVEDLHYNHAYSLRYL